VELRTLLLVEDNPDDEALTLRALRKHGIARQVIIAHDGVEALEVLLGPGAPDAGDAAVPALVLLDLLLPRMDGLTLLARLRADERTRHLPVVILTSSKDEGDIERGYALGANSYVRKPVDYLEFDEAARQIGAYWLGLNEPAPCPPVAKPSPSP
jgi:two-component system, response regulator